jgi:23S rRNA (uracil1939-C5)-methyltransferase
MAKYEIQPTVVLQANEVFNHLQRIGKVELPEFEPILGSEKQFYRNKMEFSFEQPMADRS